MLIPDSLGICNQHPRSHRIEQRGLALEEDAIEKDRVEGGERLPPVNEGFVHRNPNSIEIQSWLGSRM